MLQVEYMCIKTSMTLDSTHLHGRHEAREMGIGGSIASL